MALKVAVQMDPIEKINIQGDSTFALMLLPMLDPVRSVILPPIASWV